MRATLGRVFMLMLAIDFNFRVDLLSADVVKSYRADAPQNPRIFRRGDHADAEPAVPGWTLPVDDLFDES